MIETQFRRGLVVASVLSCLAGSGYLATMLWARNELAPPESVVAAQSLMFAHDGSLYYDLTRYPYTVCAYMPLFYLLEAGLVRLGLPVVLGARFISFLALIGVIILCGKIALLYTGNRYAAWCAWLFAAVSPVLLNWGTIGHVDMLAYFLSLAAFYFYSRYRVHGEHTLVAAAAMAVLATFTKQTALAAPVTIFVMLCSQNWKKGIAFGACWAGILAAAVLAINSALSGRFLANTVFANMNPLSAAKLSVQLIYLAGASAGLLVLSVAGVRKMLRGTAAASLIYLAFAAAIFLATAPKIGSDTNYQVETTALLAICSAIALSRLNFFELYFAGSKNWVTLLLLAAAVHIAIGCRVAVTTNLLRVAIENIHRSQIERLQPYVAPSGGLVLSTDFNAMVRLRKRMDIEPLIYTLLVSAGKVDPEPVRRDLERGAFSTVILGQDLFAGENVTDPEIGTLPPAQLEAVRKYYRQVARVSVGGLESFVYQPAGGGSF